MEVCKRENIREIVEKKKKNVATKWTLNSGCARAEWRRARRCKTSYSGGVSETGT